MIVIDKLTSPVNGYTCKRITKQNVKRFGFDSIDELLQQYPNQPLQCQSYIDNLRDNRPNQDKNKKRKQDRVNSYNLNPKTCLYCDVVFVYECRRLKFCNSSCAAKYNNQLSRKTEETKEKISETLSNRGKEKYFSNIKHCLVCSNELPYEFRFRKTCSELCYHSLNEINKSNRRSKAKKSSIREPKIYYCKNCNAVRQSSNAKYCGGCVTNIRHYRSLCKFEFNVYDYPDKFDISLIENFGWFSPNGYKRRNKSVNLDGVSRDHLYSVSDGFINHVDPKLLSHPANCKLMIHNGEGGNNAKGSKSALTLDELKVRIANW
jgi:predicted nucleic acid-binding Zn ribbon protein